MEETWLIAVKCCRTQQLTGARAEMPKRYFRVHVVRAA